MITGAGRPAALRSAADRILAKPFDLAEIDAILTRFVVPDASTRAKSDPVLRPVAE